MRRPSATTHLPVTNVRALLVSVSALVVAVLVGGGRGGRAEGDRSARGRLADHDDSSPASVPRVGTDKGSDGFVRATDPDDGRDRTDAW